MRVLRAIGQGVSCVLGIAFVCLALSQWWFFSTPDVNPFIVAPLFQPGMLSQVANFAIVIVYFSIGIGFFKVASLLRSGNGSA